jgi:VIT1/CCC1 family predicted Fe2+/Mn2+ transporter
MKMHTAMYLRSVIFGINDSLVSTVGFLAGISAAGVPRATVILAGIVYALVEAFSMATGDYLSEESAREYVEGAEISARPSLVAALFMFVSSIGAAFVPLAPYLVVEGSSALGISAAVSIFGLFVVGMLGARISRLPMLWRGVRMAVIGGLAIALGVVVGSFAPPL